MRDHHKAMLTAHTMLLSVLMKHLRKPGRQHIKWEDYENDVRKIISEVPGTVEVSPELIAELAGDFLRRSEDET